MKNYTTDEVKELLQRAFDGSYDLYDRYTNIHGLQFYLVQQNAFQENTRRHIPEWYTNFRGFFKANSEFQQNEVTFTFGVTENYRQNYKLQDEQILQQFLYLQGEHYFRRFLNSITKYGAYENITILRVGDDAPPIRDSHLRPIRDKNDDLRLIAITEKAFANAILENNGMDRLVNIPFLDICFTPAEFIRNVKIKLVRPEYMEQEYGVLTESGKHVLGAILRNESKSVSSESEVQEMIRGGETRTVEFKESLRWDMKKQSVNRDLEQVVVKTIAAFLNTDGGTLLIGVRDDGSITGLNGDYNSLTDGNWDKFQQHLTQVLTGSFSPTVIQNYISSTCIKSGDTDICVVSVRACTEPVIIISKDIERFYVRMENSSREIEGKLELAKFCSERFN
jgi:ribosomal protein L33